MPTMNEILRRCLVGTDGEALRTLISGQEALNAVFDPESDALNIRLQGYDPLALPAHVADKANPHAVTKAQVGLGNLTNEAQIPASAKGAAGGVAALGADGLVPAAQLPVRPYPNLIVNSDFIAASQATPTLSGTELIVNGGFDADVAGWTPSAGLTLASVTGGDAGNCLQATVTGASGMFYQSVAAVPGKTYCLKYKQKSGTTYSKLKVGTTLGGGDLYDGPWMDAATFTESIAYFTANTTTVYVAVFSATSTIGRTFLIDSVSLQETLSVFSGANAAFDGGWYKTNATVTRETGGVNVRTGSLHAAKAAGTASDGALKWSPGGSTLTTSAQAVANYAGRTVTFGAWIKCATAGVVRLSISDGSGTSYSNYHSGGGGYEWLEISRTVAASPTQMTCACNVGTATAWLCQPMLAFAAGLGAGNYQPWRGVIPLAAPVLSYRLAGAATSTVTATALDVTADTQGRIGKGNTPAVRVSLSLKDSGQSTADASINLGASASGAYELTLNTGGLAVSPSVFARTLSGTVNLNASGLLPLVLTATGTNTATAAMTYNAVEV